MDSEISKGVGMLRGVVEVVDVLKKSLKRRKEGERAVSFVDSRTSERRSLKTHLFRSLFRRMTVRVESWEVLL